MKFKKFIYKILGVLKRNFYIRETIILYECKKNINSNIGLINKDIKIKKISELNLNDLLYFQSKNYIDIFKNFLKLKDIGYMAYYNNKCVHRTWVKFNCQTVSLHSGYRYTLNNDEIFIHYCETSNIARGHGIYPKVLATIINEFNDKIKLISVNIKNKASIKGVQKVGFRERERVKILVILGIKILRTYKL
jgi:hypothetical protein